MPSIRALLIEDNPTDAFLLKRNLGSEFDVVVATSFSQFVQLAHDEAFDVVLADYNLGNFTGLDALEHLHKQGLTTPMVLVSGSVSEKFLVESLRKGVRDYLLKNDAFISEPGDDEPILRLRNSIKTVVDNHRLELKSQRTERLESLGFLTAGIGHDLNNCLQHIFMAHDLIAARLSNDDRRVLDIATGAARRGAEMLKQLMVFVRGTNGSGFKIVSPGLIIGQLAPVLKAGFPKNIEIVTHVYPGTEPISCVAGRVQDMITNLAANARDAMPSGGTITIEVQNCHVVGRVSKATGEAIGGDFVLFSVSDTGTGIPAAILKRIFEPFFTTKPVGQGTGFGLSNVLKAMREHHGYIDVTTAEGVGSTFQLYFPTAPGGVIPEPSMTTEPLLSGDDNTVLLADDEVGLHRMTRMTLEAYGYRVIGANDGLTAYNAWLEHQGEIDAIVTDISMPVMSGTEFVAKVRETVPSVPVVFITGELDCETREVCLRKPFAIRDLLAALKKAIATKPVAA